MKITGYRTLILGTPWRNLTYLILETDVGVSGVGEARVVGKTHTVLEYLRDKQGHFMGADVHDIETLYQRVTRDDFGVAGEVAMTGLALVEMACWDCIGKAAGLPVYQLVGGKVRDRIPAYANGWYRVERIGGLLRGGPARGGPGLYRPEVRSLRQWRPGTKPSRLSPRHRPHRGGA